MSYSNDEDAGYDSREGYDIRRSPVLKASRINLTPEESPQPQFLEHPYPKPSRRRRRRGRTKPNLGDAVLISAISANHPEIANRAGNSPLNSNSEPDSFTESGASAADTDVDMDDDSRRQNNPSSAVPDDGRTQGGNESRAMLAAKMFSPTAKTTSEAWSTTASYRPSRPVTRVDENPQTKRRPESEQQTERNRWVANGVPHITTSNSSDRSRPVPSKQHLITPNSAHDSLLSSVSGRSPASALSSAVSPRSTSSTLPPPQGQSDNKLPPIQPPLTPISSTSPNEHALPPLSELIEISDRGNKSHDSPAAAHSPYHQRHASYSAATGNQIHSPSLASRHLSIGGSGRSPQTLHPSPIFHTSPISAHSEGHSPNDSFRRPSTLSAYSFYDHRRGSQVSEHRSPPGSDAVSPDTISATSPNCDGLNRMSIEGAPIRLLPPPLATGQAGQLGHVPVLSLPGYKCDYPGCTAQPFQTQYLLSSHKNVHSSNRPHYCPEPGCPRSEGGQGFKRKNEMIRHGLVHKSPGYICPFCPDREHRYPRPDNLQRHVRVHHGDKDKDDPQLREVLNQRPEGGNRGRRRRGAA